MESSQTKFESMRCERVTWAAFHARCRRLVSKIRDSGFTPDLIVGIARGGYTSKDATCWWWTTSPTSGDTFDAALSHLAERGTPRNVRTAVLDHKVNSPYEPDYFGRKVIKWRWIIYPPFGP